MNKEEKIAHAYQELVDKLEADGLSYKEITDGMLTLFPLLLYYNLSRGLDRPATYKDVTTWTKDLSKLFRKCMLAAHEGD